MLAAERRSRNQIFARRRSTDDNRVETNLSDKVDAISIACGASPSGQTYPAGDHGSFDVKAKALGVRIYDSGRDKQRRRRMDRRRGRVTGERGAVNPIAKVSHRWSETASWLSLPRASRMPHTGGDRSMVALAN